MDNLIERLRNEEDRRSVKLGNRLSMRYAHREDVRVLLREAAAALEEAREEREALREALECMIIGACAVAVPHNGERAVLQDAVNIARAAIAAYRKGGKQ